MARISCSFYLLLLFICDTISTDFLITTQWFLQLSSCNLTFLLFVGSEKKIYYYDNIKDATLYNVVLDNERWKNWFNPVDIYLLQVNNRNTRKMHEICPKLTVKTPERPHWCCSGVFIVNLEHTSHLVLMFLLLTLNM